MAEKTHRPEDDNDPVQETGKQSRHTGKKDKKRSKHINGPKAFDVQEVEALASDPKCKVEDGETVDLGERLNPVEQAERLQKMMMRRLITFVILGLLIVWILAGMVDFFWKGDSFLLLTAFPLGVPLLIVMFHFFETRWTQSMVQIMTRTPG
ncbi:MAG TPA: hypothetical protein VFB12_09365 [Ktedonobacteraceae bacterium]|nr:hypothetical protein [Ktedonobacteraceae bacterium]